MLVGPPGSGKTNLLLLRAQFIAGSGEKNVLIITYTRSLVDFIRSGIAESRLILPKQVQTYHSWANQHILEYLDKYAVESDEDFNEDTRKRILELVVEANKKLQTPKLYNAIFVDEAQDFTVGELEELLKLSDNVCICGDSRQSIYNRDGLDVANKLGLLEHELRRHYRIGQKIAHVADRLMPPADGTPTLESTSNYNPKIQGESSANMHACKDRNEQFEKMTDLIKVQLDAFKGDTIGIFCCKKDTVREVKSRFDNSGLESMVCVHGIGEGESFSSEKPIHVLTMHSAKGTEFRAVHIFGAEEMANHPFRRTTLGYTAITRAKTALNIFRTGDTTPRLESALAEPAHVELDDIFPGDK